MTTSIHRFEPKPFVWPFLAHALGMLCGARAAYLVAAKSKSAIAFIAGAFFLCRGIASCVMIPAPAWFVALDLVVAYLSMAWRATRFAREPKA